MNHDEIIREVRVNREAYAKRFGYDIRALYREAKEREGSDGRPVVSLRPQRTEPPAGDKVAREA